MSRTNPRKAIDALMPLPVEVGGLVIKPMTLGLYAVLEKIGSPLLTGETVQTLDWLPTLYLLTHDVEEALNGSLADKALAWANTQPVTVVEDIRRAACAQMGRVEDVIPQSKKKTQRSAGMTAGSSNGSTMSPDATVGATMKSCGRSRRQRSRLSSGATDSPKTASSR